MGSLLISYYSLHPLAMYTEAQVDGILRSFAHDKGYLIYGRTKTYESLLDKMQSGRYSSIDAVDDLVAFSIIIDTRNQEQEVVAFLQKAFRISTIKRNTIVRDETHFMFDCTRCYARLHSPAGALIDNAMLFEIQIRTILQHAWSKITHSEVYKARRIDSRKARLAAELMAHIESLDRVMSTFSTTSRSVRKIQRSQIEQANIILKSFERLIAEGLIEKEFGISNNKRLADNILSILDKRDEYFIRRAAAAVEEFVRQSKPAVPKSISLYEIALVALDASGMLRSKHSPYFMSDELLSLYPHMNKHNPRVLM